MNPRYQRGGDLYAAIQAKYGTAGADRVATADASEDRGAIARELGDLKYGPTLDDSTASLFYDQITTDPLAAPLESANHQIAAAVLNVFKNPWVLGVVVLFLLYQLGALPRLKGILAR